MGGLVLLSDSYEHGLQAGIDRRSDLERAALNAEWDGAVGDYAGVIRQLRHRGTAATIRAKWIYRGLLFVILLGLAFYLGLPYWERYVDGTRETLESQQAAHLSEHAILDQQRFALIEGTEERPGLLKLLELAGTPLQSGVNEDLRGVVVDGQNILLFGAGGVITRSTDSGANFVPVPSGVNDNLWDAVVDGKNILLFGAGGVITRSTNGGAGFEPICMYRLLFATEILAWLAEVAHMYPAFLSARGPWPLWVTHAPWSHYCPDL
ncbi:WD40/YVTN/BNR-like repeat-containing protein [Leisingera aquaemixtae]|uniref:Uncharacterized protein n=1 Tax=Leisingera aquaemixtae TaxID=1396826 RepID=A0A0P1HMU2_9RHOB|nr:hypothetical protein [Leisingera aquaemixtae]CUH99167.1 putative protein related to plant photosystem II stability/assembly factor [Leisingera aquaemixtae]